MTVDLQWRMLGSPTVSSENSDGAVVGGNTLFYGDDSANYYSSISINEIAGVLDALGISYEKDEGTAAIEPEPQPEQESEIVPEIETSAWVPRSQWKHSFVRK